MSLSHTYLNEKPEGQATYEMANLSPARTGLPFVVWVSQRDGAQHDVRVKVGYNPKLFPSQMGVYSIRPFAFVQGQRLALPDERLLEQWINSNLDVLIGFWDADIEYTEDMIGRITRL